MSLNLSRSPSRRGLCLGLLAAALASPLAACGDAEPQQRAAFIAFLKTRILDKPGIHLPVPSDEERKSFGPYAQQFDVIADFNHALDASASDTIGKFGALMANTHTVGAVIAQKDDVARMRDAVGKFSDALKQRLDAANAARAALSQPDELKPVYAAAFDRDVTAQAQLWLEAGPVLQQTLGSFLDLAAFVDQHKGAITVNGPMVSSSDPKLLPPLNALMKAMNDSEAKARGMSEKIQKMTAGL